VPEVWYLLQADLFHLDLQSVQVAGFVVYRRAHGGILSRTFARIPLN
jgi:hypothetical protein